MRLYDTARGEVAEFRPGPVVTMYTCGITPYDATHVGHAATYVLYDVLQRRLRDIGHRTLCVRNITDVDDDLLRKAREVGMPYLELAATETARFECRHGRPGHAPRLQRAARHVGHPRHPRASSAWSSTAATPTRPPAASTSTSPRSTGSASSATWAGTRCWRWRPSGAGTPTTRPSATPSTSCCGSPRRPTSRRGPRSGARDGPGWHIECSALALRELGVSIDLHGGGTDLIFPHHECETAQSEAATGERFVRHWLHAPMVELDGTKMSKSLGNLVFISDLVKDWDPMAVRLAILDHSYRAPWAWHDGLLPQATERLERWRAAGAGDEGLDEVRAALDDDLDLPRAVAAIDEATTKGGVSRAADAPRRSPPPAALSEPRPPRYSPRRNGGYLSVMKTSRR